MDLSPLLQMLIVAVLAYGAGLLLGLSFYRGEIGPGRRGVAAALRAAAPIGVSAPAIVTEVDERRRRRRRMRRFQDQLGERVRQVLVMLFILVAITVAVMVVYMAMKAGGEILSQPARRYR